MHSTRKVKDDLIYVGGSDRRLSRFENLFPIPKGVSYNSYVLLDEKTVLFDTADESISRQYIENVVHALNGRPLDYMIVQHMEPDHCAMIAEWKRIAGSARKKVLYTFTFPFFMLTYIPISIAALVGKVEWKPIQHGIAKVQEERESA